MMKIRLSEDRELAQHGWLESRHTFSFANYYDPRFTGFRSLIVINEDRVDPGHGFGRHSHEDMEILSYVIEGALEHKDSIGSGSILKPGDVQIISAGTGIAHSEFNASKTEAVHFLQIWMLPERNRLEPSYAESHFSEESRTNALKLIGSKSGREASVKIQQDIDLYASILEPGKSLEMPLRQGRGAWLQLIYGALKLNGTPMKSGDGLAVEGEKALSIIADFRSEFLLFDIA
jgi:redox-sensitive bicupin YhaK (pirin superfamily)